MSVYSGVRRSFVRVWASVNIKLLSILAAWYDTHYYAVDSERDGFIYAVEDG